MRSERESDESTRLLGGSDGFESWPRDWSGGGDPDDERALRELREGLVRGRVPGGARWEVPVRAAIAAAVAAFVVVGLAVFLLLRPDNEGEPVPLISTSAAAPVESPASVGALDDGVQVQVHVVGQVRKPGVVSLSESGRVQDAIEAAGGATGKADLAQMNLARKVVDGERILVPKPGEELPDEVAGGSDNPASAVGSLVDLNTATVAQLDELPGVGPVLAGRIVEWRDANGRFATVDDLNEVSGIGDATMEKLRPLVRV